MLKGYSSEKINIQQGVGQDCPLSPLLFNIVMEMLALATAVKTEQ